MNDGKAAIPLLKGIQTVLPNHMRYGIMDAGYDYVPIYQQIGRMNAQAIIAYNKRNEGEIIGFDSHFAPTCVRECSYRYDSYDRGHTTEKRKLYVKEYFYIKKDDSFLYGVASGFCGLEQLPCHTPIRKAAR
ncbi:hypothetical protein EEL31_18965 [Brevibacillus laterosporus]|nr:hypothetical protein EEL31_18965 [Brevibacillus laterosporus]